jgi:NAD(P)-dependent dehydrogenase (short-subunit alcohol dehydrogenase family)
MHEVPLDVLHKSFAVNLFGHQHVAAAATRVMRRQQLGGALLFNASKAAFNPGPDFGPYAIPKAALVALMKQYALENGDAGIRSNAVNADRVRTGLLPPGFVAERAAARGLSEGSYFASNLLGAEVRVEDVAQAFTDLALAERTTGCVVTVDGGNIAAAPR